MMAFPKDLEIQGKAGNLRLFSLMQDEYTPDSVCVCVYDHVCTHVEVSDLLLFQMLPTLF